jgi:hypothetical protein
MKLFRALAVFCCLDFTAMKLLELRLLKRSGMMNEYNNPLFVTMNSTTILSQQCFSVFY